MATINILFILSEYSIFHPLTDIHLEARHPSRGPDAWMCSSGKGSVLAGEVTSACCRSANLEHNLCSQSCSPAVKTRFHRLLLAYMHMQAMFDEVVQHLESLFRPHKIREMRCVSVLVCFLASIFGHPPVLALNPLGL